MTLFKKEERKEKVFHDICSVCFAFIGMMIAVVVIALKQAHNLWPAITLYCFMIL